MESTSAITVNQQPEFLTINNIKVPIKYLSHPSESPSYVFKGGKSIHVFNLIKRETPDTEKKNSEKWWASEMCYGNEIAEGCEEILKKGIATLKVDGTNGFVFEFPDESNPGQTKFVLYRRQDPKLTKDGEKKYKNGETLVAGDFVRIEGGIPCQEEPFNKHFPFQRPLNKGDKWETFAFEQAKKSGKLCKGSVEIVGSKIQSNCDNYAVEAGLVYHGMVIVELPQELRTFEGLYEFFKHTHIEGLIFYHEGKVVKVRRDAYEDPVTKKMLEFPEKGKPTTIVSPLWC